MEEVNTAGQTSSKQVIVNQSSKADGKQADQQQVKKKTQKIKKVVKKSGAKTTNKSNSKAQDQNQTNIDGTPQALLNANEQAIKATKTASEV